MNSVFVEYESTKKKLNSTLESIGVSPVNISGVTQHSHTWNAKGKLKKVLNVCKENIFAAYVSDIDTEEPSPIYDWDTKNFRLVNSICKKTEVKQGDTCTTFPGKR